jgi:hypothetical protein
MVGAATGLSEHSNEHSSLHKIVGISLLSAQRSSLMTAAAVNLLVGIKFCYKSFMQVD